MASGPPLIALKSARLSYGGPPLFEALDIGLLKGERACLVGRNGSGKSSLLKALAGRVELDAGERFLQPGCVLGYLPQDPAAEEPVPVAAHTGGQIDHHVGAAIANSRDRLAEQRRIARALAGFWVAHVDMGHRGTGIGRLDRRLGDLPGRNRQARVPAGRVSGPGHRAGNDHLGVHIPRSCLTCMWRFSCIRQSDETSGFEQTRASHFDDGRYGRFNCRGRRNA